MELNFKAGFKWPELQARLSAWGGAGDSERESEGQDILDSYTLSEAKAWLKRQVADRARATQDTFLLAQNYSPGEAATWAIKRTEAATFKSTGKDTDAPVLALEASASGRTLDSIATRVLANATAFQAFSAQCAGNRAKHHDAIDKLATFDEVARYDYSTGWPA
jgi:hypothetical protein